MNKKTTKGIINEFLNYNFGNNDVLLLTKKELSLYIKEINKELLSANKFLLKKLVKNNENI